MLQINTFPGAMSPNSHVGEGLWRPSPNSIPSAHRRWMPPMPRSGPQSSPPILLAVDDTVCKPIMTMLPAKCMTVIIYTNSISTVSFSQIKWDPQNSPNDYSRPSIVLFNLCSVWAGANQTPCAKWHKHIYSMNNSQCVLFTSSFSINCQCNNTVFSSHTFKQVTLIMSCTSLFCAWIWPYGQVAWRIVTEAQSTEAKASGRLQGAVTETHVICCDVFSSSSML